MAVPTGVGGNNTFVVSQGETISIAGFGGVGVETQPSTPVMAEVDTIKFQGEGLSARNMLLTQQGTDVLIAFDNVEDTQVTLENFKLEDLDNLQQSTGSTVDLGNILFNGQTEVRDSFDVINADSQPESVFNKNSVTFLNNLNNDVKGFENSNDVINAQGGDDILEGLSGEDLLRGGTGLDFLKGQEGDDDLYGGAGADFLLGDTEVDDPVGGNDVLDGGDGSDYLFGSGGNDALKGGDDNDELRGGAGADSLVGNAGDDLLTGEAGSDLLTGGTGNDVMQSGSEDDYLDGNEGNDLLTGEAGSDLLTGSAGNDTLTGVAPELFGEEGPDPNAPIPGLGEIDKLIGGTGKDTFVLGDTTHVYYNDDKAATAGIDDYGLIIDFDTSEDVIQLKGTAANYSLGTSPSDLPAGTAVFLNQPTGKPDELIALIQGNVDLSFGSTYFNFVSLA